MTFRRGWLPALVGLILNLGVAGAAEPPPEGGFSLPVTCRIGEDCWFVNYFDADSGPEAQDFRCGFRSYEGHDGTDIAVYGAASVTVTAAAAGKVVGTRDGEADGAYESNPASVAGKECGNSVRIDHGGGWITQYCHMRRGSVRVRRGQTVERGTALGSVGQSGQAQFPHVHLSIKRDGIAVDPFNNRPSGSCGSPGQPLWAQGEKVAYQPFALFALAFADRLPKSREALAGPPPLSKDPNALVAWASVFGPAKGDELIVRIQGPGGMAPIEQVHRFDAPKALWTFSLGRKRPAEGWPAGTYKVEATARRIQGGERLEQTREAEITLP